MKLSGEDWDWAVDQRGSLRLSGCTEICASSSVQELFELSIGWETTETSSAYATLDE